MIETAREGRRRRRKVKLAPRYAKGCDDGQYCLDERSSIMNLKGIPSVQSTLTPACRCFILKSFNDANFHKSLKYGIWSSTYTNNILIDQAFRSGVSDSRPVLFFFSVCNTRHFNGIAKMISPFNAGKRFLLWEKLKYDGYFHVEWLVVKDVPNHALANIKLSNTQSRKSITSCRDCEEIPFDEARRFISIFLSYPHQTSAWDDYDYFEDIQPRLLQKRGFEAFDLDRLDAYLQDVGPADQLCHD